MDNKEFDKIISLLHPLERKVLPFLEKDNLMSGIVKNSGLKDIEVMRAVQWLENKSIVKLESKDEELIDLDSNGISYAKTGLPEKRFLNVIKDYNLSLDEISSILSMDKQELSVCIGTLKGKVAIEFASDKKIKITDQGLKLLKKESLEELFLKKNFPIKMHSLQPEEKFAFETLKKRREIVKIVIIKDKGILLTDEGKNLQKHLKNSSIDLNNMVDSLTPKMLKAGSWKNKTFRGYDIQAAVSKTYGGRRHFVNQATLYIKKIWLELGFKEMQGNIIQTCFWDLDALFVPQDHPAREMQDTFYIKNPAKGKLPKFWEKIKDVHENGADTGSTGWKTKWSKDIAEKNLLRTHTTVLSAQTIANLKKEDLPAKFFSVGKVYRNEALDAKHLFEFFQVEGIVIDPNANMKHLKGYLTEFYKKMGLKVRMRPAHFPYTEPSVEIDFYDEKKGKWIEFAGAGIFRPEVVKPLLGFEVPILAWGNGLDRIISQYYKVTDIRDLYKNDLKQLREIKSFIK